RKLTIPFIKEM
ncbi:hypothetical protein JV206_09700, partial [Shewanella indica]